jgi:hypothetical protein
MLSSHRIPSKPSLYNPILLPFNHCNLHLSHEINAQLRLSSPIPTANSINMFSSDILPTVALTLLISCQLACATPINPTRRQDPSAGSVTATLIGVAGAQYTVAIAMDESVHPTNNALSISHIDTASGPCDFFGADGVVVSIPAAGGQDVGPPQTIVAAACGPRPAE